FTTTSGTNIAGLIFGDVRANTISGFVFNDINRNGSRDGSEPGLLNVTVYLDNNNNGVLDAGEPTASTDGNGFFTFSNLATGTFRVRQVVPTGFTPSTALPGNIVFTNGGNVVTGVAFGDFLTTGGGSPSAVLPSGNDSGDSTSGSQPSNLSAQAVDAFFAD